MLRVEGRNLAFDALAEVTDTDPDLRGGEIAAALNGPRGKPGIRELFWKECVAEYGEEPMRGLAPERFERGLADAIRQRAGMYEAAFDGATIVPGALRKWWVDAPKKLARRRQGQGRMTPEQMSRRAEETLRREREEV